MRAFLREISIISVLAIVIFTGLQLVVQDYNIREYSMEPNIHEGQRIIVIKLAYKFQEPERGDVVIIQPPSPYNSKAIPFIKRIIALPGDTVEIKMGSVYLNGTKIHEDYIKEPPNYTMHQHKIPENDYFVLGDNRNNSNDSHAGWTVPRQNLLGKAWLSIWPPDKWGPIAHYPLQEQLVSSMNSLVPLFEVD